jgi:hypothetical protein
MRNEPHVTVMRRIATAVRASDSGISIIEVLVAALIFMLISIGVAQATINSIRLAGDQRHRVTALSLAAAEIDLVRSMDDPFKVETRDPALETTLDGVIYTINRTTEWVDSTGTDIPCGGAGTANLQVKRVNVRVTWAGQLSATEPVSTDTVLAPDGRLNDPTLGTIVVSAVRDQGAGSSGVTVTVTPISGGATALTTQPPVTNTAGCSYALKVKPGKYRVTLSRSNFVDGQTLTSSPWLELDVVAGESKHFAFEYDRSATFNMTYAPGAPAGTKYPNNLDITFYNKAIATDPPPWKTGMAAAVPVFPRGDGYLVFAGRYKSPAVGDGCASLDPAEWPAQTSGGTNLAEGSHGNAYSAVRSAATAVTVRMGLLTVKSTAATAGYLTAVKADPIPGSGDPGCGGTMTYTFDKILTQNTVVPIALPFGSWKLYYGTTAGALTTPLTNTNIVPTSNVATGLVSGNTVTLDPRPVAP